MDSTMAKYFASILKWPISLVKKEKQKMKLNEIILQWLASDYQMKFIKVKNLKWLSFNLK